MGFLLYDRQALPSIVSMLIWHIDIRWLLPPLLSWPRLCYLICFPKGVGDVVFMQRLAWKARFYPVFC
jgi:hypothetical protein